LTDEPELKLQLLKRDVTAPSAAINRMTMLIWGRSGCGKTELAATAPGKILWVLFDDGGTNALANRPDASDKIVVLDLSAEPASIVDNFRDGGIIERQLDKFMTEDPDINTVVFDSVTQFSTLALVDAVNSGKHGKNITLEQPGQSAYTARNSRLVQMTRVMSRVTAKHKCHMIYICHEKDVSDDDGKVSSITLMLSGGVIDPFALNISEIWHMADTYGKRIVTVRPHGVRSPMRTRMFDTKKGVSFQWNYDPETDNGIKISDLYEQWCANHHSKIALPT
jgi:hypothetical protein